jgi:hypothetical protein
MMERTFLFFFFAQHFVNALFDPGREDLKAGSSLIHMIMGMGIAALGKRAMKLGYSDVYSFRGAHRE